MAKTQDLTLRKAGKTLLALLLDKDMLKHIKRAPEVMQGGDARWIVSFENKAHELKFFCKSRFVKNYKAIAEDGGHKVFERVTGMNMNSYDKLCERERGQKMRIYVVWMHAQPGSVILYGALLSKLMHVEEFGVVWPQNHQSFNIKLWAAEYPLLDTLTLVDEIVPEAYEYIKIAIKSGKTEGTGDLFE